VGCGWGFCSGVGCCYLVGSLLGFFLMPPEGNSVFLPFPNLSTISGSSQSYTTSFLPLEDLHFLNNSTPPMIIATIRMFHQYDLPSEAVEPDEEGPFRSLLSRVYWSKRFRRIRYLEIMMRVGGRGVREVGECWLLMDG